VCVCISLVAAILPVHTAYEDGTVSVPKRRHKIQTPGNLPKEGMQHSKQGESLKSRKILKSSIETEVSFARMVRIK
jgi:hypothetical protein